MSATATKKTVKKVVREIKKLRTEGKGKGLAMNHCCRCCRCYR